MRKNVFYAAAVLSAIVCFLDSCQKESEIDRIESHNIVFSVGSFDFKDDSPTKVVPSVSSTGVKFLWAQGDTVGIYPTSGSQLVFPVCEYGSTTSSFDGGAWRLSSDGVYYAYVPYVADIRLNREKVPVSFSGQIQTGNADSNGLRDYVFMSASGTPPIGKDLVFNFKRLGCLLWIDLPVDKGKYSSLAISVMDGTKLPVSGTYNLLQTTSSSAPDITYTQYVNSLSLTLKDVEFTEDGSTLTCYMMTAPVDLSAKTIKFVLSGDNGHVVYTAAGKNLKKAGAIKFSPSKIDNIIDFEDDGAKQICLSKWDADSNGEIEYSEIENVTSIEGFASSSITSFNELKYFTSISSIADNAFYNCSSLKSITLPDGIENLSIGDNAFYNCSSLTTVGIPDGIELSVGERAFEKCRKMTVTSNKLTVANIGKEAFSECDNLSGDIILTDDVDTIPVRAFNGCKSVEFITIPESVSYIDSYAFKECSSLTSLILPETAMNGPYALFSGCTKLESVNIPSCWTNIGDDYFNGCLGLETLAVPVNINRIGGGCFYGCRNLNSISLPESLLQLCENCFKYCTSLEAIIIPPKIMEIPPCAFGGCSSLSDVQLPDKLAIISEYSFSDCSSLKNITLPTTLTSMGIYAFINSGLTSIVIPDSVTYIGKAAFERCFSMTECTLSNNLKVITSGMFYAVPLTSLTIPSSVEMIYPQLNSSLQEITLLGTTPPTLMDATVIPDNNCPIYVPSSSVAAYKSAPVWCNYADRINDLPGGAGGDTGGEQNFD